MSMTEDLQAFPVKAITKVVASGTAEPITDNVVVIHLQADGVFTVKYAGGASDVIISSKAGMDFKVYGADTITCTAEFLLSK